MHGLTNHSAINSTFVLQYMYIRLSWMLMCFHMTNRWCMLSARPGFPLIESQTVCGGKRKPKVFVFVRSQKDRVTCRVESAGAQPLRSQHLYCLGSDYAACKLAAGRGRWISPSKLFSFVKCVNGYNIDMVLNTRKYFLFCRSCFMISLLRIQEFKVIS